MNDSSSENRLDFTGNGTLNINGTISGSGTLNEGSGTINYNNSGNQTVAGTTYNHLSISGTGVKSMYNDVTVNGTLTLDGGSLSIGNNILDLNGNIVNNAGSLRGGTTSDIAISGSKGKVSIKIDQTSSTTCSLNNLNLSRANGANLSDTLELDGILPLQTMQP